VNVEVNAAWGRSLLRVTGSRLLAWSTDETVRPALHLALQRSIEGARRACVLIVLRARCGWLTLRWLILRWPIL
jgi:hypothetical protein